MARFKKVPQIKHEGKITYGSEVINNIVMLAINELDYIKLATPTSCNILKNSSINVKKEKDGYQVDVEVIVDFTQSVSELAFKIQEAIRYNVESMTDYHVSAVNVVVKDVSFPEIVANVNPEQAED